MGTFVDPAYLQGLHQDLIIACHRLEESGHETLVLIVNQSNHLVFGSEKGKRFLEERHAFLTDFILKCQNKETIVKVEREVDEEQDDIYDDLHIEKDFEAIETNMYYDDETDDLDDNTENSFTDDIKGEKAISTSEDIKLVHVSEEKEDSLEVDDFEKVNSVSNENLILNKMKQLIHSNQTDSMTNLKPRPKTSRTGIKDKGSPICDICGLQLANWTCLKNHKLSHHKIEPKTLGEEGGRNKDSAQINKVDHHMIEEAKAEVAKPESKKYICDTCGSAYMSSTNLNRHMEKHKDSKVCHCGAVFSYKESLQRHMKAVHLGGFKCKHCQQVYKSQTGLNCHIRKEHGNNPLQCNVCGKTFGHNSHLKDHSLVHLDVKQFYCEICGKRFKYKRACKLHMTRCIRGPKVRVKKSKPTVYTCPECNKSFSSSVYLKQHEQKHENEMRPCPKCGRVFKYRSSLSRHVVRCI